MIKSTKIVIVISLLVLTIIGCDTTNNKTLDQNKQGVSYHITTSEVMEIDVFTDITGQTYNAEITYGNGSWNIVYLPPTFCFKRNTYENNYCVNDSVIEINLIKSLFSNAKVEIGELSVVEEEVQKWVPANELVSFASNIEISLNKLRQGDLQNGMELVVKRDNGRDLNVGSISNLKKESIEIMLPSEYVDLMQFGKYIKERGFAVLLYPSMIDSDDAFIKQTKLNSVNLDDFRVK